jgi:hypothetical protein
MDFTALQQALTPAGSTVTISTETLPAPFADFLKSYYAKQGRQIVISNAQLTSDAARGVVAITGRANVLDAANLPVAASFSLDATGNVAAVLRYTLLDLGSASSGWKFSWLLRELPGELSLGALALAAQLGMPAQKARRDGFLFGDLPSNLDRMPLGGADLLVTTGAYTDPETQLAFGGGIHFLGQLQPMALLGPLGTVMESTRTVAIRGELVVIADPTQLVLPELSSDPFAVTIYPWEVTPALPGVHLQAALGLETRLGNLVLRDTALRLYSPPSADLVSDADPLRPLIALTGRFLIPSANIELDAIARMPSQAGETDALLEARCHGLSIANLAAMADLAGAGDSISALPDSLGGVIRGLAKLELTDVVLRLTHGTSGASVAWASFAVGAPGARWNVWRDVLAITDLGLRVNVTDPFGGSGTRSTDVAVTGTALIEGVPIEVVASTSASGFSLAGVLLAKQTLPLAKLMKTWAPDLPVPGDLTVDQLRVSYASGGVFRLSGTLAQDPGWKIAVGPGSLAIEDVVFDLSVPASGSATGSFRGAIAFSPGVKLAMAYDLPGSFVLRATCDEISLRGLAATLSNQKVWLPNGFDLTLRDSSVLISSTSGTQGSLVFQLATRVEGAGLFAFEARDRAGGAWGFVAGFDLGASQASSLPGLAELAAFERMLHLGKLMLVVATFADAQFQFPDAAQFQNPRIGSGKVPLPGAGGIAAGLNLFAEWSIDGSDKVQKMLAKLLGLGATMDVTLQVSEQQTRLFFRYDGKLLGQPMSAMCGVQSVGAQLSWFLAGTLTAKIQGHPQVFDVAMAVTPGGALFSGDMKGATAVDCGPFKLSQLALEVGVDWAGIPSLGIAATIDVKQFESSVAVFFDSTDPARSLVAGSLGDLTMKDVFDTLTGGAAKSPIDGVLKSIAIRGTGAFSIAGDLAADLDGLVFDKVAGAFAAAKVQIPAASSQLLLVVNKKGAAWHLTDLTTMRHYQLKKSGDKIQVSIAPQFYFAPQPTSIGMQRYPQAFFLDAALAFAGFDAAVKVDISAGKGIAVDAQMDRITILDDNLFSISALQGGGGPKLSLGTFQQPNQPDEKFRPPHFYVNGRMGLLGAKTGVYASISAQGIDLELKGSLVPSVSFDLDVRFGKAGLGAAGSCKVGVNTVDLGSLGKAKINTTLDVSVELDLDRKPSTVSVAKGGTYAPETTVLENELLKLVFQQDGNLVLYRGGGTDWDALWDSGTNGKGASKLAFQQDGNLVIYTTRAGKDAPIWDTRTAGRNVSRLALQDDCNLVLYDGNNKPFWASDTAGQMAVIAMESGFTFAGQSYHIARFRLAAKPDTFPQLPSILADKIEAVLVDAYKDATKWVDATKQGCIDGVNDTSKVLRDYYKKSEDEAKKLTGQATSAVSHTAESTWKSTKKTINKAKFW